MLGQNTLCSLLALKLSTGGTSALPTDAPSSVRLMLQIGILRSQLVPFLAVSTEHTLETSALILFRRDGLQVLRINTSSVPAEVVEFQPIRDGADVMLIRPAVSSMLFVRVDKPPVAVLSEMLVPYPALAFYGIRSLKAL